MDALTPGALRAKVPIRGVIVDRALLWVFVAGLAWCPFWFGSNVLLAWGVNAVLFPGLADCGDHPGIAADFCSAAMERLAAGRSAGIRLRSRGAATAGMGEVLRSDSTSLQKTARLPMHHQPTFLPSACLDGSLD